jgi:hypothetical protein
MLVFLLAACASTGPAEPSAADSTSSSESVGTTPTSAPATPTPTPTPTVTPTTVPTDHTADTGITTGGWTTTVVSGGVDAVFTRSARVPTVVTLRFDSAEGEGWAEAWMDGALARSTSPLLATQHEHTLLGLKASTAYDLVAVVRLTDGTELRSTPTTFTTGNPPVDLPESSVAVSAPGSEMVDGFLVLSLYTPDASWALILDGEGDPVWWVQDEGDPWKITRARISQDGRSMLWSQYDRKRDTDIGEVHRLSLDTLEETVTRAEMHHHDFVEHSDGTVSWLGWDMATVDVEGDRIDLAADVIRRAPEGWTKPSGATHAFSFLRDFPHPFWWVCDHMDFNGFAPGAYEFTHSNSLALTEDGASYLLMARYIDTILKIDAATGSVIYELGGLHSTLTLPAGQGFAHGHFSHAWDDRILVFDNGNHRFKPVASRVVEYRIDEAAGTAEEVWEYPHPEGDFVGILGDARRLPGGHTLVNWSTHGRIEEVEPDGSLVWQLAMTSTFSRMTFVSDL